MSQDKKQFAVIGLGRFGMSLCLELSKQGVDVLAIDIDIDKIREISVIAPQAIVADCSKEEIVQELKLDDYDIVMVAIGEDIKSSIITTLILKELGVKRVWVKAKDQFHHKILLKIGADRVINPERDMGISIAESMLGNCVFNYLPLGNALAITELIVTKNYSGKQLRQHPFADNNKIILLAYKRGAEIVKDFSLDTELQIGDILIVTGLETDLMEIIRSL